MKNYTKTEIESLITRFEGEMLPKPEWTHEAHLVVAIWYTHHYPINKALELVRTRITKHNESVGTPNTDTEGYHETITRFWLLVAQTFLKLYEFHNIADACNDFINSEYAASSYPLYFYSEELLFSVEARHNWVEPNKQAIITN